ncbi:MAG: adenosine kinase [Spirochaetota bacterium]
MLYGIGNPLMDVIVRVSHESLRALGVMPGTMNLVDFEQQQAALAAGTVARRLPGGSCANTVRGVRWLMRITGSSASPLYTGAVGGDHNGDAFEALLDTEGVEPRVARKHTPTGSSVILVTPDSQRTMFTYLGACRDLAPEDIDMARVRSSRVFHTTGYMWDTPNQEQAAREAIAVARGANRGGHTLVSFDVADPFVVRRYRDSLVAWIPGNVDLLFANEEELRALTGVHDGDDERVLRAACDFAPTVVMKLGARGCLVWNEGTVTASDPHPAERVDTTGAGDAFAAGYLYGVLQRLSVRQCAQVANILAGGIVAVDGCNYDAVDADQLRPALHEAFSVE